MPLTASVDPVDTYTGPIPDIEPYIATTPLVQIRRFEDATKVVRYMLTAHRLRVHRERFHP